MPGMAMQLIAQRASSIATEKVEPLAFARVGNHRPGCNAGQTCSDKRDEENHPVDPMGTSSRPRNPSDLFIQDRVARPIIVLSRTEFTVELII